MILKQIFIDAIGTGELITVIYSAGHAPGAKRRLIPLALDEQHLRALDDGIGKPKLFFLSKIEIVADDYDAPWARDI